MKKVLLTLIGLVVASAMASAQSISSFYNAYIDGISVSQSGNTITLNVDGSASVLYNGTTYNVTDVFGVWALDFGPNPTLSATGGTTVIDSENWTFDSSNGGGGRIRGWKTNPNTGLTPPDAASFTYTTLSGDIDEWGYHVRFDQLFENTGGYTAYFYHDEAVPEPATMALAAPLALAWYRRKRKNA